MGIFQSDTVIHTAIQMGLDDLRKNLWLIDDILSDFTRNPYLKEKYGQAQIDSCKEWFENNQIDVYMRDRNDKDRMPCITISLGTAAEKEQMKTMADKSVDTVILMPNKINKPIPYIVKPFTPTSYDPTTGEVGIDQTTPNVEGIAPGMILVNPANGQGYVIQSITVDGVAIDPGIDVNATQFAIVPKYPFYVARREHTFFEEVYSIGCHAHGDVQTLLWLHAIVVYIILRYRESLLEAEGFAESKFSSSDLFENPAYTGAGGEMAWSRVITLSGQTQYSWIKSPKRIIENVALVEKTRATATEAAGYIGGISIISNTDSAVVDKEDVLWYTDTESEADED